MSKEPTQSKEPISYQPPQRARVRVRAMAQQGAVILSVLGKDRETIIAEASLLPDEVIDFLVGLQQCAGLRLWISETRYSYSDGKPAYRVRFDDDNDNTNFAVTVTKEKNHGE
jgi:hypothetical protein